MSPGRVYNKSSGLVRARVYAKTVLTIASTLRGSGRSMVLEGTAGRLVMSEVRKSTAIYFFTVGLCLAGVTGALKLWKADPSVPLIYGGDAFLTQLWVKSVVENGSYLTNTS